VSTDSVAEEETRALVSLQPGTNPFA